MVDTLHAGQAEKAERPRGYPLHDEERAYQVERGMKPVETPRLIPMRPETEVAYTTLDLSPLRPGSSVTAIDSPEAKSLIGCFEEHAGGLVLMPGRLHLGARRRLDTGRAVFQMMCLDSFHEAVSPYDFDETVIISILREGPILRVQENLYLATGLGVQDNVLISVHHVPDDQAGHMGLRADADYQRSDLSEREATKIKHAIVVDSIAGGRNTLEALRIKRQDLPNLETVTMVSIHASLKGIERIVRHSPPEIKQLRFFCLNTVIAASMANHYDCYLPRHRPETMPDPQDLRLFDTIYGQEIAAWVPFGGDWSANYLNPTRATRVFEEQLGPLGVTSEGIMERTRAISLEEMEELGFDRPSLMPYSTLLGLRE
ncbi:hypothetical protein ACFLWA_12610 [Chloroflexota bacterium]